MERHILPDLAGQPHSPWRDAWIGVALHMVASILAVLLFTTPFVAELEQRVGLGWLFHMRGARPAPDGVAIVAIDGKAAQDLNLPLKPSEWPRSIHARLVDALASAGARVIVFDMTFATPSKSATDDEQLAAAIASAGNVILVDALKREDIAARTERAIGTDGEFADRPVPPIPSIAQAALAHTPFPLPKQGRVDAFWTFIQTVGDRPTLPVVAYQAYSRDELDALLQLSGTDPAILEAHAVPSIGRALDGDRLIGAMQRVRTLLAEQPGSSTRQLRSASPDFAKAQSEILRNLVGIYSGDNTRYLDFYGPPRTIPTLSYADALDTTNVAALAGKAVFVGFSGASAGEQDRVRDHYPTVFSRDDGVDLSGVEIAATAFANLLEERAVRPLTLGSQLALVALFGSALGALVHVLPQRLAYIALLAAGAIYLAVAHLVFASSALWLPLVVPLGLQLPLAALAGTWQRYRLEQRRHQDIRRTFARFLPPDVVDQLVDQFNSGGEIRWPLYGVCLGTDMEGYTGFAESLAPDALGGRLNAYYATLFEPVERHGGFVSDIVGDAMLAIWGASANESGIRRNACLAALDIAEIASAERVATSREPALRTRIGLNAGEMDLVAIGASRHFEFRPVGDTVNTAARIEGLSKYLGTRLLVSAAVIEGLDEFLVRPVGTYVLAGKSEPVRVFELVARRQTASGAALALCRDFAHALQVYESGAWQEAALLFARILESQPDDGPSHFFAQRCARHASDARPLPWTAEIRISAK